MIRRRFLPVSILVFMMTTGLMLFQNCSPSFEVVDSGILKIESLENPVNTNQLRAIASPEKVSAISFIPNIKSVTWYANYGDGTNNAVRNPNASAAEFVQQLPRIKQAGFNTVWISDHSTWSFMQPWPEQYRAGFDETELDLLKYMLQSARAQGLKVMLPINGYGYGHWHSGNPNFQYYLRVNSGEQGSNYDLCTWFNDQTHGNVWIWYKWYAALLMKELKDYHDMVYFFVYSEAGFDDLGTRCTMTKDFYQNIKSAIVRRTYGNLPAQLDAIDPTIMQTAVLGYHDDHAISDAWVSSNNLPINSQSQFDFISTHGYYDGYDQYPYQGNHVYIDSLGFSEIVSRIQKRLNRIKAASPNSKVMLGEFGISNCRITNLERQTSVFRSIRYAVDSFGAGSNMWAWTPIYANELNICDSATGGYYLTERLSGTSRPLTPLANWLSTNPW